MFFRQFLGTCLSVLMLGALAAVWFAGESTAWAQYPGRMAGRHGPGDMKRPGKPDPRAGYKPLPLPGPLTPHGGEYVSTETHYYEIVYMPLQTRIYLFDDNLKPQSAKEVHARMALQLPAEKVPRQVAFQYVAMPPGATEQDFVAAGFDLRLLREAETPITFEFAGLPDRRYPTASFTPYFTPAKIRPYVAKVLSTDADRDGIARQQVCPVTGTPLGSRGPVVKLYVADMPLYVSGEDCIAAVKAEPQRYLPQPQTPGPVR